MTTSRTCGRPTADGTRCRRTVAAGRACPAPHRTGPAVEVVAVERSVGVAPAVATADPFTGMIEAIDIAEIPDDPVRRTAWDAAGALVADRELTAADGRAVLTALAESGADRTDDPVFLKHLHRHGAIADAPPRFVVAAGGTSEVADWVFVEADEARLMVSSSHLVDETLVFGTEADGQRTAVELTGFRDADTGEGVADAVNHLRRIRPRVDAMLGLAADYCDAAGGARPGMCHPASWTLREEFPGVELVEGERGGIPHTWNVLPDGRILDATAAQFGDPDPGLYRPDDPRYTARRHADA